MSSSTFFLVCLQALLIQNVYSQAVNFGRSGYTGLDVEVDAVSRGLAGLSGYGLGNAGLAGLSLGNAGLSGISLGNAGLSGISLGNAGLAGVGISNAGLALGGNNGFNWGAGISDVAALAALPVAGPYGGTGFADLAVGGEMDAAGAAVITGQIPVLGAVSFNGQIPASGVVSIAGNCGCASVPL